MSHISLAKKFSLLLALFVSLTVGVLYLLVSSYNEPVRFAEQEKRGNSYQRPVVELLKAVAEHHVLTSRAAGGGAHDEDGLHKAKSTIEKAFADLKEAHAVSGESLQFTEQGLATRKRDQIELSKIEKKWTDLKSKSSEMTLSQIREAHSSLIADLRTTITHLGDTSNLILDPDLDSYYLMDMTLLALPQTQDRIQSVWVEFEPILRGGRAPTTEERVKASVAAALMKESDLTRISGDLETTLHEDGNFNGKSKTLESSLAPAQKTFAAAYEDLIKVIQTVAEGKNPGVENFVKSAETVNAESYAYWTKAADELDHLLEARMQAQQNLKVRALVMSIVGLMVAIGFGVLFLRGLIQRLNAIVQALNLSSSEVLSASNKSSGSSSTLSGAATEQAASLQQTMASVEQIAAMVRQNADSASRTQNQVEENRVTAEDGSRALDEMMIGIQEIRESNDDIVSQMEAGNKEIEDIVKIIKTIETKTHVINDIVSQTKLLSFNASVEAARAGEHGKGFAVVAEEVGNLARMSGNAAKEIDDLLTESLKTVNSIVERTRARVQAFSVSGREKIARGEITASKCKDSLTEITQKAHAMLASVTEIAHASREQSQGVQEINKAMSQLGQVTQQNLSVAQESSHQATALSGQAKELAASVHQLKEFIDGYARKAA